VSLPAVAAGEVRTADEVLASWSGSIPAGAPGRKATGGDGDAARIVHVRSGDAVGPLEPAMDTFNLDVKLGRIRDT
jgi:hypothetical protein